MKAYVVCTGSLFGVLTLVHLWRMVVEPHHASDPWYLLITAAAATLGVWAWRVLRQAARA